MGFLKEGGQGEGGGGGMALMEKLGIKIPCAALFSKIWQTIGPMVKKAAAEAAAKKAESLGEEDRDAFLEENLDKDEKRKKNAKKKAKKKKNDAKKKANKKARRRGRGSARRRGRRSFVVALSDVSKESVEDEDEDGDPPVHNIGETDLPPLEHPVDHLENMIPEFEEFDYKGYREDVPINEDGEADSGCKAGCDWKGWLAETNMLTVEYRAPHQSRL